MGIFEWVKGQTGTWGPALLDFYYGNAGWINALVMAYGLLLLLSWQNLSRVSDSLVGQILEQAERMQDGKTKGKKPRAVRLGAFTLSWEEACAASRFPFVARQTGLMIHRSSPENVRSLITERDLIQRCSRRLEEMGLHLEKSR
ncbi:MAG TPA: hypothetical protein VI524_10420 [Anaerolineales bacterium]|nr:hypothetical protein [Anaerolineales bacterium]